MVQLSFSGNSSIMGRLMSKDKKSLLKHEIMYEAAADVKGNFMMGEKQGLNVVRFLSISIPQIFNVTLFKVSNEVTPEVKCNNQNPWYERC